MKLLALAVLVISLVLLGACATTPGPTSTPGPGEIDAGPDGFDLKEINGSGNIIEREIVIENFSTVEVIGEGKLIIEQGDIEGLIVETDDNLIEYIEVSVSGGKLKIENTVDEGYDLVPTDSIYYYLHIKNLEELLLPGMVTVECDNIETSSLSLDMSGVTDVELSGEIEILNISADGVGTLKGRDLLSTECNINGNGNTTIIISISEILNINYHGIGSIKYIGAPVVNRNVGSLVKIEKIN